MRKRLLGRVNIGLREEVGCLHACIEHGMAIVVLVGEDLYGSALALVRLQFEAYVRGIWLAQCASDSEVDKAGRDDFPKIDPIIKSLESQAYSTAHFGQ
jgi:hypothetical protein